MFEKPRLNPTAPSQTVWYNGTGNPVKVDIFKGPSMPGGAAGVDRYIIDPGEEAIIPSQYDYAIQTVNDQGEVVAGLAPQLTKVAQLVNGKRVEIEARPKLVEALDPNAQARKEAEAKAEIAANAKALSDQALVIAEGDRLAAQRRLEEAEQRKAETTKAETEKARKATEKGKGRSTKSEGDGKST